MKPARRLPSETHRLSIGGHIFDASLAYDPDDGGRLREVVFVSRGKVGHGLDLLFHDLGIQLSRIIQGRNPETGAPILEQVRLVLKKTIKLSPDRVGDRDDGGLP